jgi:hypothetical protein
VDGFRAELFPKPIGKNRHPLALQFGRYLKKLRGVVAKIVTFLVFLQQFSLQLHLKIIYLFLIDGIDLANVGSCQVD